MINVINVFKSKLTWLSVLCVIGCVIVLQYHVQLNDYLQLAVYNRTETDEIPQSSTTDSDVLDSASYVFRFRGFYNKTSYVGKPFDTKWNIILKKLNLLKIKRINDDIVLKTRPKIVTAFSDNHFGEGMRLASRLNKVLGNEKILYVYDIGLNDNNKKQFSQQWSKMIIELRNFSFDNYPDYVRNLLGYRWKPLIIAEMLNEVYSFWWMDSSVEMQRPITSLYDTISNCSKTTKCPYYPWLMPAGPREHGHSIFATTDKRMSVYLPYSETLMKSYMMTGAHLMLIYGTNKVKEEIMRLWVLCALEKDCMAPTGTTMYCSFTNDKYKDFAKCHRYDQSAVNILLAYANNFDVERYSHYMENAFSPH